VGEKGWYFIGRRKSQFVPLVVFSPLPPPLALIQCVMDRGAVPISDYPIPLFAG